MKILGISAFYHDSAAALVIDGEIVAAAEEERFSRRKHDRGFPAHAIRYCLSEARIGLEDLDAITFYDKPLVKFERLLETYLACAPRGFLSFVTAMPVWLKEKLFLKTLLLRDLESLGSQGKLPPLLFTEHHQAHAASAFYPSPFQKAAVLCLDGVGEWATSSAWLGDGATLTPLWELRFPHSLGLLYSAFTYYAGFKVNSGEYKLMGLAPYGQPRYVDRILSNLLDLKEDGTFHLDMSYFGFATGLTMTSPKFHALFEGPPRSPESPITQRDMDIARSIQCVTEEIILRQARALHRETGADYLCLAGGVALNCVANGRLLREGPFKDLWIQPAAGDSGGALGAALATWHEYFSQPRTARGDAMKGALLGPRQEPQSIRAYLDSIGAKYDELDDASLFDRVAGLLEGGAVIGWLQGRMEFGPRALGARSILGDARNPEMQTTMNLRIKHRESFRPFAPAVLADEASRHFELDRPSPYMLLTVPVRDSEPRLPAITHVDRSARVQTVDGACNPRFAKLLERFRERTGVAVLVNTSFNVRGEPMVCDAADAYRCFMRTDIDHLVLENFLLSRPGQPALDESEDWKNEFTLD